MHRQYDVVTAPVYRGMPSGPVETDQSLEPCITRFRHLEMFAIRPFDSKSALPYVVVNGLARMPMPQFPRELKSR